MSKQRKAKAQRRLERERTAVSAPLVEVGQPAPPVEVCPKCGKPHGHDHDHDLVIHFPEAVFEWPKDFKTRYEVVYERTMFKYTHCWVCLRSASQSEKDELRRKLTEKYRRKPRKLELAQGAAEQPSPGSTTRPA